MKRRGRPKHPDVLTPREWEVLALIREGLSNDEIARRLGISLDGAKYHVSEILSKLGLENRADAALWRPEEARPWWVAAGAPFLFWRKLHFGWLSPAIAGGLAVAVAAGIGVLVWALLATRGEGDNLSGLTPEEFADTVRETLTGEGEVFHTSADLIIESAQGETQRAYSIETWLGPEHSSRHEFRADPSWDADVADQTTSVIVGDTIYISDGDETWSNPIELCEGIFETLRIFMPSAACESLPDDSETRLVAGVDYEGTPAVALELEATIESEEPQGTETRYATSRFYFDRETLAPLAWVSEYSDQGDLEGTTTLRFDSEFLPADSLPDDFFDPTSIGYVTPTPTNPNPAAALDEPDLGVTVYWLGREFAGEGDLPPLRLVQSERGDPPGEGPGYRVAMSYRAEDGGGDVIVWLWEPETWESYRDTVIPPSLFGSRCAEQVETEVDGARAVIFMVYEPERQAGPTPDVLPPGEAPSGRDITPTPVPDGPCPDQPFDLFMAHVYFDDAVVTINTPLCIFCAGRGFEPDPYDSRAGMEAIVRAIKLRQSGE